MRLEMSYTPAIDENKELARILVTTQLSINEIPNNPFYLKLDPGIDHLSHLRYMMDPCYTLQDL